MGTKLTGVRVASQTTIEINFRCQGRLCRERLKLKPTPANLKRAAHHRSAIILAIENGSFDYATTFPDSPRADLFRPAPLAKTLTENFLESWIERQRIHLKVSTWNDYNKIIRGQILPAFGQSDLTKLALLDIKQWLATLNCGNKRIGNILSVFRVALDDAVDDGIISNNVLAGYKYKRKAAIKYADDIDPFSPEEQKRILDVLDGQGKNFVQFSFWSGLRTSELVALNWDDIDLVKGVCKVYRALTQNSSEPETTKTPSGIREVKILPPALEALNRQREHTFLNGKEVFQNPRTHGRWTGDQPIRKTLWQPAIRLSGVRYRRPYQTRHTYASMMLSAGEHPMWVASQMGHADWTMISRIYGRWMPDAQPDAGSKATKLFAPVEQHLFSIKSQSQ
jgi:integrase